MSAVTLNLRIAPSVLPKMMNKSSKQKPSECLPSLPEELIHLHQDVLTRDIIKAQSLEAQIIGIRQAAKSESNLRSDYCKLLVFWYFHISSGSCLKTVLASSLNKDDSQGTIENHFFNFLDRSI
jgi:hypothetical protein